MESFEKTQCHNESWFVNSNTKFIVDGIELSSNNSLIMDDIVEAEKSFIERLRALNTV